MSFDREVLGQVVMDAATITERMAASSGPGEIDDKQTDAYLKMWCEVMADGDKAIFEKRLRLDHWTPDQCRVALGKTNIKKGEALPEWGKALSEIVQIALADQSEIKTLNDWLGPFVFWARKQVRDAPGGDRFSADAWEGLEDHLVRRLSFVVMPTLEMKKKAVQGGGLWGQIQPQMEILDAGFLSSLRGEKFVRLLCDYPVLGRLMATVTLLWIETTCEFLRRLTSDWAVLAQMFGRDGKLGLVRSLTMGLSDAHNNGRTVIRVGFGMGETVYYKPRDMHLDAAFGQLLLNIQAHLLPFYVPSVLVRDGYGWMAEVTHKPCQTEYEVKFFYKRLGMLLGLVYGFGGSDFHHENIIACGAYPVLIDLETLMLPVVGQAEVFVLRSQRFAESVLRTHLLPRWDVDREGRFCDSSGMGFQTGQDEDRPYSCCVYLNEMRCHPGDYREDVVDGFRRAYRFLLNRREELLADGGAFAAFRQVQIRTIFQNTSVYDGLIKKTLHPKFLRNGVDRSVLLEFLLRPLGRSDKQVAFWPRMKAEMAMVDVMDVPYFFTQADSTALMIGQKEKVDGYFAQSAYTHLVDQMMLLSEDDLAQQVAFVRGSFYFCDAGNLEGTDCDGAIDAGVPVSREDLIAASIAIGKDLCQTAIREDGALVTWYLPESVQTQQGMRLRYAPADLFLYGGRMGVAFFLAALSRFANQPDLRPVILSALHPVVVGMQDQGIRRYMKKYAVLGAGEGIGSLIYGLTRVGLWLDAPDLHDAVRQMARMVTPDKIAQDDRLDVLSGSAGALLGLLALYAATGEKDVIDRAVCCGEHLLACRVVGPNGHRAWPTLRGKLVAGMGHGAAGIAYALLRLVGVTGRKDFLDAAIEGFAFEQDAFSDEMQNWRGFGSATDDPVFLTAFCHGAPGIGLARLGALDVLDTPSVRQEIETALHTTEKFGAKNYDHLCCGHAGRMEIMAVTALKLDQPEWLEKAQQRAGWMLSQCEKRGGFRLFDVLSVGHPGLFKGTAGIGYQFLRLAYPDQVPSVLLWE